MALKTQHRYQLFLFSGVASCTAELCTVPIDVVKIRMQLQGELGAKRVYSSSLGAFPHIVREEGLFALWKGVQPALLRQATYGSLRIGMYEPLKEALMGGSAAAPSVLHKLVAGVTSGALASGLCNPTDVVKVRMQAQATGKPRYRHVFHAFSTIAAEEGVVRGLYRGVGPTMQRAAVVAGVELASYDECKGALVRWAGLRESAYATHFSASLLAGFLATLASSPLDVVKSRVMNQPVDPATGRGTLYASSADCFRKAVAAEGVLSLWKGFGPNFARIGPHVVITFMTIERLRLWFAPPPPPPVVA